MSETTDTFLPVAAAPPVINVTEAAASVPVVPVAPRDWVRLAEGFYFLFFGLLATFAALAEALVSPVPRFFQTFVSVVAVAATLAGAWRLFQARISAAWRRRTRELLIAAGALAYLWPFFHFWLRLSGNLYLLGHALVYAGLCLGCPALLSLVIGALAQATGLKTLATQAWLYAAGVVLLLLLPFSVAALGLVIATLRAVDPLLAVRLLAGKVPQAFPMIMLVPVSLSLSLAWAAKDLAIRQLAALGEPHEPK